MRYAICTALYEAGRPYLDAYASGLGAAVSGNDAVLVVAVDDFASPEPVIETLRGICPVIAVKAPAGASPAQVRQSLILAGLGADADILIFADMDDMLAANAPGLHADALAGGADISFGDLDLIDARGAHLHRRFFAGVDLPRSVTDPQVIAGRNFLGLSNTAVRAAALPDEALHIPADIIAADWWLFTTLLRRGLVARRTMSAVGAYRVYGGNTLGAGVPATRAELLRVIDIAVRHHRAFPGDLEHARRRARLEALTRDVAASDDLRVASALNACAGQPGVWFECLDRIDLDPIVAAAPEARIAAA